MCNKLTKTNFVLTSRKIHLIITSLN